MYVLEALFIPHYSHWRRGSSFHGDKRGLVGEEATASLPEDSKRLLQSTSDELWHPEV